MRLIVLLSAYNGEPYIREQLDSLFAQTLDGVEILVRDDGSIDGTRAILAEYADRGVLKWYAGENLGTYWSFWQLLTTCGEADYYAFCDQDDVWDADKLETAVKALVKLEGPALYCGDVRVTDEKLHVAAEHMVRPEPADYPHALIRNLAPGCTYVFNRAARDLLCRFNAESLGIELHDLTAYQIITCFGQVIFDSEPHMSYRQHGGNVIGAYRPTMLSKLRNAMSFWNGPQKNSRSRQALRLERAYSDGMSPDRRELTALYAHYREDRKAKRKLLMERKNLSGTSRFLFILAIFLNRL